jgi:hypothetical protein
MGNFPVKLILNHQESRTLQNVDIAPQHESIQTIIFIQPGLQENVVTNLNI